MCAKTLLPTLRTKKRYVVYEVIPATPNVAKHDIFKVIEASYKECFGVFGLAKAKLSNTNVYNPSIQRGIIKVNNKCLNQLRVSIMMITNINNNKLLIKIAGVSGIIKKAKAKYMKEV